MLQSYNDASRVTLSRTPLQVAAAILVIAGLSACRDARPRPTGYRGLPPAMAADMWYTAVRSYPSGIPPGARSSALRYVAPSTRDPSAAAIRPQAAIEGTTWLPIGPAPISDGQTYGFSRVTVAGRASVVAANPAAPLHDIWLGAASGGAWHSHFTENAQWEPMLDEQPSLAIGAIKLQDCIATARPHNPSGCATIWIGTGEDGIRRDTYYGAGVLRGEVSGSVEFPTFSWTQLGADLFNYGSVNNLLLDPAAHDTVYVALSSGVTASSVEATVPAPTPAQGFGIYKSVDRGDHWVKKPVAGSEEARPTVLEMDPQDPNRLYAGFQFHGFFRSVDGGTTWSPMNTGLPSTVITTGDFPVLAVHRPDVASPAILYAVIGKCKPPHQYTPPFGCSPGVYQSVNGGDSWTQVFAPDQLGSLDTYTMYTHALTIHPTDPNTVFYGGTHLWKSTDGGHSWADTAVGSVHPDHHQVVFPDPGNANTVIDVNDGGIYFSSNGGDSFDGGANMKGLQITQLQSISYSPFSGAVLAGTQDNGTNLFTGPKVWAHRDDGDSASTVMDADDPSLTYDVYVGTDGSPRRCNQYAGCAGDNWPPANTGIDTGEPVAWYPPLVQDPSASAGGGTQHPLYFATNRLYRSVDDAVSWTAVSPNLGGNAFFPDINTSNVITAIAVAPSMPGRIYVGYFDGQIYVTDSPSADPTAWSRIDGPGKGLPVRVVTALAVDPDDPNTVYVSYSGFGTLSGDPGSHVFRSTDRGGTWTAIDNGVPNVPVNAMVVERGPPKALWLGTDIGVFRRPADLGMPFLRYGNGLPNVTINAIAIDEPRGRLYAATHGRGAYVLTRPRLDTFEGWVNGAIWDIPVYGHGFLSNTSCTMTLLRRDGSTCAAGSVDAQGGTIGTDVDGNLVTDRATFYQGRQVAWGCYDGTCLGGVNINQCTDPNNPVTTARLECGGQTGITQIGGCPAIGNPPSTTIDVGALGNFGARLAGMAAGNGFQVYAAVQVGDGSTRILCNAPVQFSPGETVTAVLSRAVDALNQNTGCAAEGVTAFVAGSPVSQLEDLQVPSPTLALRAPGLTGTQLFAGLASMPGDARGVCFGFGNLGMPVLGSLLISKLTWTTAPGGAGGGTVSLVETTPLGNCEVQVATAAGESAGSIAAAAVAAFQQPGVPSPNPLCRTGDNLRDVTRDGDSLIFVSPSRLTVCVNDPGLGVLFHPDELDLALPPRCSAAVADPATIWPPNHGMVPVVIRGVTDPSGLPVTLAVTSVRQDEAVHCAGCGNTGPDAVIEPGPLAPGAVAAHVRAERAGGGDGRVYHIAFTGTNSGGTTCLGEVKVCVPHDGSRTTCGDQGALFPSTP